MPGKKGAGDIVLPNKVCKLGTAKFILESEGLPLPRSASPSMICPDPRGPDMKRIPLP